MVVLFVRTVVQQEHSHTGGYCCPIGNTYTIVHDRTMVITVIPKMHMPEKHVVDWLDEWQVGLGLMGEQGAESISTPCSKWCRATKMYDEATFCTYSTI